MSADTTERRLAAIMFTDVVGYTALMARDESAGRRVRERHTAVVRSQIARFHGEWIEERGDESLTIFPSALDAVHCALAIQQALRSDPDLQVRIGIHLGDVTLDGGRVLGDGVNVASRVRELAEPRGIVVTAQVYDSVKNQPDLGARSLGEQKLKNVPRAVAAYEVRERDAAPESGATKREVGARRVVLLGAGALVAVATVVGSYWILSHARIRAPDALEPMSQSAIAVLPFEYQGSAEFAFLGEGLVNLLSTRIDGLGDLRRVDPHALLRFVERESSLPLDPEGARTVAEHFGAGRFVLGTAVEVSGRLHLDASLYDASDASPRALGHGSAEGPVAEVANLVDRLTAELVARSEPGAYSLRTAALTSESFPALQAYLKGETEYRAGRYMSAVEFFRTARETDPGFAIAHLRFSQSAMWSPSMELWHEVRGAVQRVVALQERLPPRDRKAVEAWAAYVSGDHAKAEAAYRSLVRVHPDDFEAWFWLGDGLFHSNPLRGRSIFEAREPFERAVAIDPQSAEPLLHLGQLDALEGKLDAVAVRVERLKALGSDFWTQLGLMHAFAVRDEAEQRRIEREFPSSDAALFAAAGLAFAGNYRGAVSTARRAGAGPASGELMWRAAVAGWEMALGHGRAVQQELRAVGASDRDSSLAYLGLYGSAPFLGLSSREVEALREELRAWVPPPIGSAPPTVDEPLRGAHAMVRPYALGLVGVRLGDFGEAEHQVKELEAVAGPPWARDLATRFAQQLRARVAWARGDAGATLRALDAADATRSEIVDFFAMTMMPLFFNSGDVRFVRAQALAATGRYDEALEWYRGLAYSGDPWASLGLLESARIHEKLGRRDEAIRAYERFVELWKDCDPELQPTRAEAEARLAALRSPG